MYQVSVKITYCTVSNVKINTCTVCTYVHIHGDYILQYLTWIYLHVYIVPLSSKHQTSFFYCVSDPGPLVTNLKKKLTLGIDCLRGHIPSLLKKGYSLLYTSLLKIAVCIYTLQEFKSNISLKHYLDTDSVWILTNDCKHGMVMILKLTVHDNIHGMNKMTSWIGLDWNYGIYGSWLGGPIWLSIVLWYNVL